MIASLKTHIKWMLSGRMGTISSGRVLSFVMTIFSLVVLSLILHRQLTATDPVMATAQASSLQWWGTTLMGLCSAPYAITKSAGTVSDIIAAIRRGKDQ